MSSRKGGGGWGGCILLAIILIGAGWLYQREGGKIFGPHLTSPPRPVSTEPTPTAGGPDQREVEAMNSEDRLNYRALQLRRQEEELVQRERELRGQEDGLREAQEKERQKQMDQAAEETFRDQQKRAADLGEAIRKAVEEKN